MGNSESSTSKLYSEGSRSVVEKPYRHPTTAVITKRNNGQINLFRLSDLVDMNNSVIIFQISNSEHEFYDLLEREQTPDDYVLLTKIISKISKDSHSNTKRLALQRIHLQSKFWHNISVYLKALPAVRIMEKFKNKYFWCDPEQFYCSLFESLEAFLIMFPDQLRTTIMPRFRDLQESMDGVTLAHSVKFSTNLLVRMELFQLGKLSPKNSYKTEAKQSIPETFCSDIVIPDNSAETDYKTMSVYPKLKDLLGGAPKLELKRDQPYDRFHQYVDRRFRMVREDIFGTLRVDFKKHLQNPKEDGIYENIQIYNHVRFTQSTVIGTKIGYTVNVNYHLSQEQISEFDENQLTFGSLVIFTRDNFKTILAGTIIERDAKNTFVVEMPGLKVAHKLYDHSYTLVECKVLFEAYRHVLSVLRDLNEDQLPFKHYIMEMNKRVRVPSYVIPTPNYIINFGRHRFRVNVTKEESWPDLKHVNMDGAQYECFQAALSRELTIIQGPPGTGKSFIGLQIVETLLNNTNRRGPILLICYTNHALDQFLEDTLRFTKRVVRFGSKSKKSALDAYNISEQRRKVNSPLKKTYGQLKRSLWKTKNRMHEILMQSKNEMLHDLSDEFDTLKIESASLTAELERINLEVDRLALYGTDVLGMTTSAASRVNALLQTLNIDIVVVEEAAEVPEAHVIASLPMSVKHLIMIGDHLQLRPATANYDLVSKSDFEISLFERLISSGVQYNSLRVQHRMRPEIAALICPLIYPHLENHERVLKYPSVKGMKANMYFLTHEKLESESKNDKGMTSYSNIFEAEMCVKLASHLVRSGYSADEITILTLYNGQLARIQNLISGKPELENLVAKVVDSYQGEENRIVILSLVRSNRKRKVGFLNLQNRICVALSRAREGLYMIGNMEMLRKSCSTWSEIYNVVKKNNAIGNYWPIIICENQPKSEIYNVVKKNNAIRNYCPIIICENQPKSDMNKVVEKISAIAPESNVSPLDCFLDYFFHVTSSFIVLVFKGMFSLGQFIYTEMTQPEEIHSAHFSRRLD